MIALNKLPDIHTNGRNFVLALWFSVRKIYYFSFGIFQEFIVLPAELSAPITLELLWNSDIIAEIIQNNIFTQLLFTITGIHFSESFIG